MFTKAMRQNDARCKVHGEVSSEDEVQVVEQSTFSAPWSHVRRWLRFSKGCDAPTERQHAVWTQGPPTLNLVWWRGTRWESWYRFPVEVSRNAVSDGATLWKATGLRNS